MKRLFSLLIVVVLLLGLVPTTALAADIEEDAAAEALYEMGLFRGTGTNSDGSPIFDLDKTPTRDHAVIMLVRLLGKEEEALAGDWELPFTDVGRDSFSFPYIGYAYSNGLTKGTSSKTYSGNDPIKANQYITFVLRAMGYETGTDFEYATAWTLSDELGMTLGKYTEHTKRFTRGDIVRITLSALTCPLKGSKKTLFSMLKETGGIAEDIPYSDTPDLRFNYCTDQGDNMYYRDKYVQNISVARMGNWYQFKISLKPDTFRFAHFFPAGYKGTPQGSKYLARVSFIETETADCALFVIHKDFIFKNPISKTRMVLKLMPDLSAFPDNFKFAEGSEDKCILVKINTSALPK